MKKTPSIARIERKKRVCGMGELPNAFAAWLRFAPRSNHYTGH